MGLINLKTDLKSLRYSKDTLGGGTSNQPYIKAKIPDGFNNLQNANNDFILRGGILAARDSAVDVVRLGKMFIDTKSPNGILFVAKQQLLSRIAVRTQTSGRTLNEGVYSPLNTLAEAGVVAFGGHLVKQGINPFSSTGAYSNNNNLYEVRMKNYNNAGNVDESGLLLNRLVSLYASKIYNVPVGIGPTTANSIAPLSANILSYPGGPNAPLGIGKTNIRFADQRTGINNANGKGMVAGTYQTTRPSQKTSNDIISPITRGASGKYLDYTKGNLFNNPLTFPDGQPVITLNGYSYALRNSNDVYQSGSLEPNFQVINSQKTRPSGRTSNNIISPITRGASGAYLDYTKGNLFNNSLTFPDGQPVIALNGYSYALRNSNNVYQSGSLKPDFQVINSQKILKSVLLDPTDPNKDKQQGGLKINTDTPWNASDYILPSVNVNSPQSASLDYVNKIQPQPQDTWVYDQKLINNPSSEIIGSAAVGKPIIQDFRARLREKLGEGTQNQLLSTKSGATPISPNYKDKNLEKRVNIGGTKDGGLGPGNKQGKNLTSYTSGSNIGPIDRINALNLYSDTKVTSNDVKNDLVKFRIAAINNKTPTLKTFMHFRAFIDNFSDSYNATWNPINYLGRGEQFYTYNGFTRTISLGWTVAAQSKEELMPMYRKLNYLASNLTPDYTSNGYMVGNLVQLTIGGYLYEQVGFITSLTYDIPAESPWEIGINDSGDPDHTTKEMPHILKVTGFSFTPIHDFIPSKQTLTAPNGNVTGFGIQKYIALANSEYTGNSDGYSYIDPTTNALK